MAKKGPAPVFEVVFDGPGVYPEKIPVGTLGRTLTAIQRLAAGAEGAEDAEEAEQEPESSLRLLNVVRGSAVYRFACPTPVAASAAVGYLRLAGQVLADPEKVGQNDFLLNPIERLSAAARALDCRIIVREPNGRNHVLATIEPESYQNISKTLFIQGETSLTGEVKRVGGATEMKCALRVPFQHRLLFCTVALKDVARKLGDCLYATVVVEGKATWIKSSWRVIDFRIQQVRQLKGGSLREGLDALRQAGGKGWDNVDNPAAFLNEVTGQ